MRNNNVAILGASKKPERYSNRAQKSLVKNGYSVFPVAKKPGEILGVESVNSLTKISENIDTVTIYLRPALFETVIDEQALEWVMPKGHLLFCSSGLV